MMNDDVVVSGASGREAVTSPNETFVGVFPSPPQACVLSPPGSLSSACTTPGRRLSIPGRLRCRARA